MSSFALADQAQPRTRPAIENVGEDLLLRQYCERRDPRIEAELCRRFMPLARSLAFRYRGGAERSEDLIQVASLGLVKALRGFDPERGKRFPAYAAPTILGELRRHFRDHSWRLHVPRSLQELSLAVNKASDRLLDDLGRSPSVRELAAYLEVPLEKVLDAMELAEAQRSVSLDVPRSQGEPESAPLVESIGNSDGGYDGVEAQLAAEQSADLSAREREVLDLYFSEGLTQSVIGERIGVSQMQVSRIMRRALGKLLDSVRGGTELQ